MFLCASDRFYLDKIYITIDVPVQKFTISKEFDLIMTQNCLLDDNNSCGDAGKP